MRAAPEHVGLQSVADRQHLARRRIAGEMQRVAVDRLVRLAVPGHSAAEPLVKIGDRAGAGLEHAAAHHHPVGVEAMHVHVARGPALEVGAIFLRARAGSSVTPVQARSVKSSPSAIRTPRPSRIARSPARADEADGPRQARSAPRSRLRRWSRSRPSNRAAGRSARAAASTASAVRGALVIRITLRPSPRHRRSRSAAPG